MSKFKVMADSSCDLMPQMVKQYDVEIVPMVVSFDKQNYFFEGIDITREEFFAKLVETKIYPKSSLPPVESYIERFTKYVKDDIPVMCFTLGADMSGSHQCAQNARRIVMEDYPNSKIYVVDSRKVTVGEGLLVLEGCKMNEAGYTIEEAFARIEEIKDDSPMFFTMNTLDYLEKGGRLGKAAALAGTILNLKPIVCVDDGCVNPVAKIRGRKKSLLELARLFAEELMKKDSVSNYSIAIGRALSIDEADEIVKLLKDKYNIELTYPLFDLGVAVGCHSGPTCIGLCSVRKFDAK